MFFSNRPFGFGRCRETDRKKLDQRDQRNYMNNKETKRLFCFLFNKASFCACVISQSANQQKQSGNDVFHVKQVRLPNISLILQKIENRPKKQYTLFLRKSLQLVYFLIKYIIAHTVVKLTVHVQHHVGKFQKDVFIFVKPDANARLSMETLEVSVY